MLGSLDNSGETIYLHKVAPAYMRNNLLTSGYILEEKVLYDDKKPWVAGADGEGGFLAKSAGSVSKKLIKHSL